MSTYVVYGATGYAGSHIVSELTNRGHSIVAVARHAASIAGDETPSTVETLEGSLFDTELFEALSARADGIVIAVRSLFDDGRSLKDAVIPLLPLAEASGVHLVIVGGAGSLIGPDVIRVVDQPSFPAAVRPSSLAHSDALDSLRSSGSSADWLSVSPAARFGRQTPGHRTGVYRIQEGDLLLADENGDSMVSGADFAVAIADELENPRFHRTRVTVAY